MTTERKLTAKQRESALKGLERTAEVLRTVGWCQHESTKYEETSYGVIGHCITGAMSKARASESTPVAFARYLYRKFPKFYANVDYLPPSDINDIQRFNDAYASRRADVLRAIRGAKAALKNGTI